MNSASVCTASSAPDKQVVREPVLPSAAIQVAIRPCPEVVVQPRDCQEGGMGKREWEELVTPARSDVVETELQPQPRRRTITRTALRNSQG